MSRLNAVDTAECVGAFCVAGPAAARKSASVQVHNSGSGKDSAATPSRWFGRTHGDHFFSALNKYFK
jgi:hypothetical protein